MKLKECKCDKCLEPTEDISCRYLPQQKICMWQQTYHTMSYHTAICHNRLHHSGWWNIENVSFFPPEMLTEVIL